MTDNALRPFEGHNVIASRIAVTNAGDGLSEAMSVEPEELPIGTKVNVVLECEVSRVQYVPVKDTDAFARVHTLKAGTGTIVDAGLVADLIADQEKRNQLAREARDGVQRLPIPEDQQCPGCPHAPHPDEPCEVTVSYETTDDGATPVLCDCDQAERDAADLEVDEADLPTAEQTVRSVVSDIADKAKGARGRGKSA